MNAERAKSVDITIVEMKNTFSAPRLVCPPALRPSPPPKAEPAPASEYCINIKATKITDKLICA